MAKPNALVGYTGFVGGNLLNQMDFDGKFNSSNSSEMAGQSFSTVYFSAAPAEKWKANLDPEADARTIDKLIGLLESFSAERLVLISTVDVYKVPVAAYEDTVQGTDSLHAYGLNRLRLEDAAQGIFNNSTIMRLPALFGPGLKKNAIFDLLNHNQVERINPNGEFQFYNMENLVRDVHKTVENEIPLLNLVTEPLRMGDLAQELFGVDIESNPSENAAKYDLRSRYAAVWGGDDYLYSKESVVEDLHQFVAREKRKLQAN